MTYSYYHNVIKGTAPKNAPTYQPPEVERDGKMMEKAGFVQCAGIFIMILMFLLKNCRMIGFVPFAVCRKKRFKENNRIKSGVIHTAFYFYKFMLLIVIEF